MRASHIDTRPKAKILCVEDDINLQKSLSFILWKEGYQVLCARTGEEALELARRERPDLVLLDLILPGIDGYKVCGILKKDPSTADMLVIILTAKKEVEDILFGFKCYADDYITKPFEPEIMLARIKALLRRKVKSEEEETVNLEIDDLVINQEAHEVLLSGKKISLTKTEFDILALMAGKPNQVFTRSRILDQVREDGYPITERVVDYHVTGLRKKLGKAKKYIQTVRGVGYKFNADENS
jgi:DNA-binding response OmpR family regulator